MLSMSCQNGNSKICKYLVAKGANPNHQNVAGQTPAHFAISFKFFDLSTWLFENGASDTIENKFGLTPYDGMTPASDYATDVPAIEDGAAGGDQ
jgi:ankyrin repeat protein